MCDAGGECHHPIACSEGPCVKTRGPSVVTSGRQQGKTAAIASLGLPTLRTQDRALVVARDRIRRVAKGDTINGTYKLAPEPALDAFRADLLLLVGP